VSSAAHGGGRVYVVVVNYRGWRDTIPCLESVLRSDYPDFQVVVCDNGSGDDSLDRLERWARGVERPAPAAAGDALAPLFEPALPKPVAFARLSRGAAAAGGDEGCAGARVVLVDAESNGGFAAGCNVGMRYALARGDAAFVWLLNNDAVVRPGALGALVERLRQRPDAGQCGSRLLAYDAPDRVQCLGGVAYDRWWGRIRPIGVGQPAAAEVDGAAVERAMDYVAGASLMATRAFIDAVGLMEERYFLYYEELDWATRGRRFALAYAHDSVVYHREGRSVRAGGQAAPLSETAEYHGLRNRLAYTRRFFPVALPTVYLGMVAALLNRVRRGQLRRATLLARVLVGLPRNAAGLPARGARPAGARPTARGA